MGKKFSGVFFRNAMIALLIAPLAVPLQLVAAMGEVQIEDKPRAGSAAGLQPQLARLHDDPQLQQALAGVDAIIAELEQADESTPPKHIPDPFHLTSQYLLTMRANGNAGDRYHLAGTEGGLPRIIPQPDMVEPVVYDGKLAFRYKHGVHVIESIAPTVIACDDELLVTITASGDVYVVDMVFARRELFKAPVPVHKIALQIESQDLRGLQLSYVTRGFSPFSFELDERGALLPIAKTQRFTAGDLVLWRELAQEEGTQRVLISVLTRDFIVDAVNNGNHLLGSLAYVLRKDKPAALAATLTQEKLLEGRSLVDGDLERHRDNASAQAEQVMQSMDIKRLQAIVARDVRRNTYRDEFTYARWQRDYLIIKDQAETLIARLESKFFKDVTNTRKLEDLKQQLRKGDFANSWIMLSKLFTEESADLIIDRISSLRMLQTPEANAKIAELESILRERDYERLWNEPHLLADHDASGQLLSPLRMKINRAFYKHLDGDSLRGFASTMLGLGTLGAVGFGTAWALRAGFGLSRIWPPNPFKVADLPPRPELGHHLDGFPYRKVRKGYRRFLTRGTLFGIALIPTAALVGHLVARGSGNDWDFRKQLTLMGMRVYATLALPFWHYLSKALGQSTLMPSMAAGVSPFTEVRGKSAIGESIGLAATQSIRVGLQTPYVQGDEAEAVRRRAIAALQQQRARAQGLGWEMAARIVLREHLQRRGSGAEIDRAAFLAQIDQSAFKETWKKLAVGLEREIYRLHTQGIFGDLRTVTYEYIYDFLRKTRPQVLQPSYYDGIKHKFSASFSNATGATLKALATVSTDNVNFLRLADPDDFLASINWTSFMLDFLTVVIWEGTYGGRSRVFSSKVLDEQHAGIGNLVPTNRFPYWSHEHANDLIGQIWAHQVGTHGRNSLIFQMLQKVEEKDYRPMEELLTAGREQTQGFWAGMFDFGKNGLDIRNADYGSRYWRGLGVALTMIQLGLLWSIFGRSFIAKVPFGKIGPQYLYTFFWQMWAFAWPWIALYSIEQLREMKNATRSDLLMLAKVQTKKALTFDSAADLQQGYDSIVAVYREATDSLPAALIKEVRNIERDLQVSSAARLPADTLYPYLGLLVQMKNADSLVAKRDIYRRLVGYIDDPQQSYVASREDAEQLLHFVMSEPPFPVHLNGTVGVLAVGAVAAITTLWGSKFQRATYGRNVSSLPGALPWVAKGLGVYALIWALTSKDHARKIIDYVFEDVLGYPELRFKDY